MERAIRLAPIFDNLESNMRRKLPKAVEAVLDQLTTMSPKLRLDVCRAATDGTETGHKVVLSELQEFSLDQPGHWRCTAASGSYGVCWGIGETAREAIGNCKKAGGTFGRKADMVLEWQPDIAWQEHAKHWPKRGAEAGPLDANGHWGSPRPWSAWIPGYKQVGERHADWLERVDNGTSERGTMT